MKKATDISTSKILAENSRRRDTIFSRFNPITGEGSVGDRAVVVMHDFPIRKQWLPLSMIDNSFVNALIRHNGIDGFLRNEMGVEPSPDNREAVIDRFIRLRSLHDFPFWAATFVYIKNKEVGQPDCLFRLSYPQRKFVSMLESIRLAGRPIRIILLKARQWGGSTTSQLYMAWLQLIHRTGLNSLIISNYNEGARKIKGMFKKMISAYPVAMLHEVGEVYSENEPKLIGVEGSSLTQAIPQRNATISIGSAESPDSCRGGDYALVHLSEVGIWKATEGNSPEAMVRSACSGVLYRPYTMIVYESTANGVGNFFHNEYVAAKDPEVKSQFEPLFISWFDIELYQLPFSSDELRESFARSLVTNRFNAATRSEREECGKYLWWLWERGATLEGIHWYIEERAKYHSHGDMASEYPSDDIEAFVNSGSAVFDKYCVEALRSTTLLPPRYVGDIYAFGDEGQDALRDLHFKEDSQGLLNIWNLPDPVNPRDTDIVINRYLTVVDVGGRSNKADWSVIVVFDRLLMMDGGKPSVVAQWYGHIDMDLLAWKAAQIAAFYDNSLLVIESNTLETHDKERNVDGDQSATILNQIKDIYTNLYARKQSQDAIIQGLPLRYGFHTNVATKPMIISTLIKVIREGLYVERDKRCIDEYLNYEKKPNGSFGAKQGAHDDLLMTRAIGLHICFYEMDLPQIVSRASARLKFAPKIVSAASF
ncbi:MAG: terminase [Bacteroidales bacterium]|nr:terminase [Bacteroidales bacterium]